MIPVVTAPTAMVSAISTTMTMIGVEIVFACTAFIASFSVICAQLQSTSVYKDKQKPSTAVLSTCLISFLTVITTTYAYMGFSKHKALLLIPHIVVRVCFLGLILAYFISTVIPGLLTSEPYWIMLFSGFVAILVLQVIATDLNDRQIQRGKEQMKTQRFILAVVQMDVEKRQKASRVLRIYITVLALIQIAIGILVFAENSSILEDAYLGSRLIVAVLWALAFSWIVLTIILHCGLYINSSLLILPHFIFSIIFLLIQLFVLLVLVNEHSRLLPILHTTSVIVVLLTTIPFEWRCYQLMIAYDD